MQRQKDMNKRYLLIFAISSKIAIPSAYAVCPRNAVHSFSTGEI